MPPREPDLYRQTYRMWLWTAVILPNAHNDEKVFFFEKKNVNTKRSWTKLRWSTFQRRDLIQTFKWVKFSKKLIQQENTERLWQLSKMATGSTDNYRSQYELCYIWSSHRSQSDYYHYFWLWRAIIFWQTTHTPFCVVITNKKRPVICVPTDITCINDV